MAGKVREILEGNAPFILVQCICQSNCASSKSNQQGLLPKEPGTELVLMSGASVVVSSSSPTVSVVLATWWMIVPSSQLKSLPKTDSIQFFIQFRAEQYSFADFQMIYIMTKLYAQSICFRSHTIHDIAFHNMHVLWIVVGLIQRLFQLDARPISCRIFFNKKNLIATMIISVAWKQVIYIVSRSIQIGCSPIMTLK